MSRLAGETRGFRGVPTFLSDEGDHRRRMAEAINQILIGKINVISEITLPPGETTTVFRHPNLSHTSYIWMMPLTASAASVNQTLHFINQKQGEVTIQSSPPNSADDKHFRVMIIG